MKKFLFTILILVFIFTCLYAGGETEAPTIKRPQTGTLVYLEGEVTINGTEGVIGDTIYDSDVLKTGFDSYCEVVFGEKNVFRLEAETIARLNWAESNLTLQQGAMGAVFNKLDNFIAMDNEFEIKTPTTVAGVRGTVFYIKVEEADTTYICICNGELDMAKSYNDLQIAAEHHKAYRFTKSGGSVSYTSAPMLYHDDPKMESIADQIGYSIPWGSGNSY
ncbi:MAG: FecR domain-containing protein [Spirochaetales bacterium]|nr:FecR domain-containing protein [Spirochaetales bacterium]